MINKLNLLIIVFFGVSLLSGCSRIRGGGKNIQNEGTDFNFTLTAQELSEIKNVNKSTALAIIMRLNALKLSRAVLSTDVSSSKFSDSDISQLNQKIIEISKLNRRIFSASCALNFNQGFHREVLNCRKQSISTFVTNFENSIFNLYNESNFKSVTMLFNRFKDMGATFFIRGKIQIRDPQKLINIVSGIPKVKFIFSDYRFLSQEEKLLDLSNVYLELSELQQPSANKYRFEIQRMLRKKSPKAFIYGSGFTLKSGAHDSRAFEKLGLPPSVIQSLKKVNAQNLDYLFDH